MYSNLTIIDKKRLEKLEKIESYTNLIRDKELTISDIDNLDVALPSFTKFLKDAFHSLKEERWIEFDPNRSQQLLWWLNTIGNLIQTTESITSLRQEFYKQKERLEKQKKDNTL